MASLDSGVCDECDGSGVYYISGEPRDCICAPTAATTERDVLRAEVERLRAEYAAQVGRVKLMEDQFSTKNFARRTRKYKRTRDERDHHRETLRLLIAAHGPMGDTTMDDVLRDREPWLFEDE